MFIYMISLKPMLYCQFLNYAVRHCQITIFNKGIGYRPPNSTYSFKVIYAVMTNLVCNTPTKFSSP